MEGVGVMQQDRQFLIRAMHTIIQYIARDVRYNVSLLDSIVKRRFLPVPSICTRATRSATGVCGGYCTGCLRAMF